MRSEARRRLVCRNTFAPGPTKDMIQVGDLTPTETNLLLLTTKKCGSLLDWDKRIKKKKVMDKKCRRTLMFPRENLN